MKRIPLLAAVIVSWLINAPLASASCLPFPPLDEAIAESEVVFVGTPTSLSNQNRTAVISVEEVWKGPDLPAEVLVLGGLEGNMMTSADMIWQRGTRYLVLANATSGRLETTSCRSMRWSDEFSASRPGDVRPPMASVADDGPQIGPLAVASVIAGVILLGLFLFRRPR